MPYTFILSNCNAFRKELGSIIDRETLYEPLCITLPCLKGNPKETDYTQPVELFRSIEHKILSCPAERLRNSVVVLDEIISPKNLDPLTTSNGAHKFCAMLMLAFPELQFTFLNSCGMPNPRFHLFDWLDAARKTVKEEKLSTLKGDEWNEAMDITGYREYQLFDPHGMREQIKSNVKNHSEHESTASFPSRLKLALSIEDEPAYGLFHGYAAFKAFHKCKVVTSYGHLKSLGKEIKWNRSQDYPDYDIALQYEDAFLQFYDRPTDVKLSDVPQRHKDFSFLTNARQKYLVSVGRELKEKEKEIEKLGVKIVYKPGKGIYNLLREKSTFGKGVWRGFEDSRAIWLEENEPPKKDQKKFDLNNRTRWKWMNNLTKKSGVLLKNIRNRVAAIRVKGFDKIKDGKDLSNEKSTLSHSAPGILLVIAESLLKRADKILDGTHNVAHAIHAATLALEAKELLSTRTPTSALHALALQHQAEIAAESLFYGVEYEMDLKPRFADILIETGAVSKWFGENKRKRQRLNAYLNILEHLAKEFTTWNQFDEEQKCLREAFKVRNSLKRAKFSSDYLLGRWRNVNPLVWVYFLFHKYVERCIASLTAFAAAILGIIVVFAGIYYSMVNYPCLPEKLGFNWLTFLCFDLDKELTLIDSLLVSFASFFTVDTTVDWQEGRLNERPIFIGLFALQSAIAFAHLSVFVSMVYQRLSRR